MMRFQPAPSAPVSPRTLKLAQTAFEEIGPPKQVKVTEDFWPTVHCVIAKNLARRLERLEGEIMPGEENIMVLHIQGVTPDRQVVSSFELKVHIPSRPPKPEVPVKAIARRLRRLEAFHDAPPAGIGCRSTGTRLQPR